MLSSLMIIKTEVAQLCHDPFNLMKSISFVFICAAENVGISGGKRKRHIGSIIHHVVGLFSGLLKLQRLRILADWYIVSIDSWTHNENAECYLTLLLIYRRSTCCFSTPERHLVWRWNVFPRLQQQPRASLCKTSCSLWNLNLLYLPRMHWVCHSNGSNLNLNVWGGGSYIY